MRLPFAGSCRSSWRRRRKTCSSDARPAVICRGPDRWSGRASAAADALLAADAGVFPALGCQDIWAPQGVGVAPAEAGVRGLLPGLGALEGDPAAGGGWAGRAVTGCWLPGVPVVPARRAGWRARRSLRAAAR